MANVRELFQNLSRDADENHKPESLKLHMIP